MGIEPPYRLSNQYEIDTFFHEYRHSELVQHVKRFALNNLIVTPPLLRVFPPRLELVVHSVHTQLETYLQQQSMQLDKEDPFGFLDKLRDQILAAADGLADEYTTTLTRILQSGIELLPKNRRDKYHTEDTARGARPAPITQVLAAKERLYQLLSDLVRRYLYTRDPEIHRFLKHSVYSILLYRPETNTLETHLITELKHRVRPTGALIQQLYQLICRRLPNMYRLFFQPYNRLYAERAKHKILRLQVHPYLKQNILSFINNAIAKPELPKEKEKLALLLPSFAADLQDAERTKIKSILDNFFFQQEQFLAFFEDTFYTKQLDHLYSLVLRHDPKTRLGLDLIGQPLHLDLYPCKDYHDYLKGLYSQDCTVDPNLSRRHLTSPHFFNIRIFRGRNWIGNIYLLDYSHEKNVLIIDRIQIKKSEKLFPIRFFPQFMEQLLRQLKELGSLIIIAPFKISNFKRIQSSYQRYVHDKERVRCRLENSDAAFESYDADVFFVLHQGIDN